MVNEQIKEVRNPKKGTNLRQKAISAILAALLVVPTMASAQSELVYDLKNTNPNQNTLMSVTDNWDVINSYMTTFQNATTINGDLIIPGLAQNKIVTDEYGNENLSTIAPIQPDIALTVAEDLDYNLIDATKDFRVNIGNRSGEREFGNDYNFRNTDPRPNTYIDIRANWDDIMDYVNQFQNITDENGNVFVVGLILNKFVTDENGYTNLANIGPIPVELALEIADKFGYTLLDPTKDFAWTIGYVEKPVLTRR